MEEKKLKKPKKPRGKAVLLEGRCIACGARCQGACPVDAIVMNEKGEPVISKEKCIGCIKCVKICPATAIEMFFTNEEKRILAEIEKESGGKIEEEEVDEEEKTLTKYLKQYRGVWVFVEQTEGEAARVSWELMGVGAELAKSLSVDLCAVVIGHNVENLCNEAFAYGANKAYLIDNLVFKYYRTEPYLDAACCLIEKYKPEIVLMGASAWGRDLAGAVATTVKTGLTADCTSLAVDERRNLGQTRPAFGGNIMATIMCDKYRPQMSTVRPHVMPIPPKVTGRTGEIVRESFHIEENEILKKVVEILYDSRSKEAVDITSAEFIVSGGRGMMSKDNFTMIQELADELGGVVAGSRGAVDAGWLPYDRQVGQTGKTVRPKIYIACGISGAIQHIVGMQNSEVIIAINRDKDAPIFEVATYGIVGDLFHVIPALTKRIRELKHRI